MAGTGRDTSVETYHQIEAEGLLGQQQWRIYQALFHHGPMTVTECFRLIERQDERRVNDNTRTRFTELREMGAIVEVSDRTCSITGRRVIEWDVTSKIPSPPPRLVRVSVKLTAEVYQELLAAARVAKLTPQEKAARLLETCLQRRSSSLDLNLEGK